MIFHASLSLSFFLTTTHLEVPALAHGFGDAVEGRVSGGRPVAVLGCFEGDGRRRQALATVKAWRGRRGGGSSGERHQGHEEAKRGTARHGDCCVCGPLVRTCFLIRRVVEGARVSVSGLD